MWDSPDAIKQRSLGFCPSRRDQLTIRGSIECKIFTLLTVRWMVITTVVRNYIITVYLFIYLVGYFNKDFINHLYNYPTIVRVFFTCINQRYSYSFRCFIGPTLTERLGNGTPPWALLGRGEEKGGLREALAGHEVGAAHGDREVFRSGRRRAKMREEMVVNMY